MQHAQKHHALNLLGQLIDRLDEPHTRTQLCQRMQLSRSPYSMAIIDELVYDHCLVPAGWTTINGLKTELLVAPQEHLRHIELYIDHLWHEVFPETEETDDELPF